MYIYILFLILIILIIIIFKLLFTEIDSNLDKIFTIIEGGKPTKKIIIVDGLNYIYSNFINKTDQDIYPNNILIYRSLNKIRSDNKINDIIFVIKNQDSYKLSIFDDHLYTKWSKKFNITIIMCYDSNKLEGEHYIKGRDDSTVIELQNRYKSLNIPVEIISNDSYNDVLKFENIPEFKKIIYGKLI